MLDLGTKRNPKMEDTMQTELSLVPGPNQQFSLIRDEEIAEEKLNSLAKLVNNMKEK